MGIDWKSAPAAAAFLLLAGCVTYPHEAAFSACDAEAGACYQYCEQFEGTPDYGECHADCEYEANQCFSDAYDQYRYADAYSSVYTSYGPSPWYGRYGSWYPNSGYIFSFNYYSYNYSRPYYHDYDYRHRNDRRHRRGDRHRDRDRGGRHRNRDDKGYPGRRRGGPGAGTPPTRGSGSDTPRQQPPRQRPPRTAPPPANTQPPRRQPPRESPPQASPPSKEHPPPQQPAPRSPVRTKGQYEEPQER